MEAVNLEAFASLLRECGYKAVISDKGYINTATSGIKVGAFLFTGKSVQLTCTVVLDEESSFTSDDANDFNSEYRFAKIYVMDRSIALSWDFLLDIERDTALEDLTEAMDIYDNCIGFMRKALTDAQGAAVRPASDEIATDAGATS